MKIAITHLTHLRRVAESRNGIASIPSSRAYYALLEKGLITNRIKRDGNQKRGALSPRHLCQITAKGRAVLAVQTQDFTQPAPLPIKTLYILAIFRHLAKHDDFKQQHDYWKAAADRQYAAGAGFADYQYKAIAAHELAMAKLQIARVLILLISPPLFHDALDLIQTGKISRFVEAGS